jgi:hypothetical protein
VPAPDLIAEVKAVDSNEVFVILPTNDALAHYAAKQRRAFGNQLNNNNVAAIVIPPELANKNDQP